MFRLFESGEHANLYSKFRPSYPQALYNELIFPSIKSTISKDLTILDVACGSGQASFDLAQFNCRLLIGIDPSQNQIEHAIKRSKDNENCKIIFEKESAENLDQVVTKYSKELNLDSNSDGVFDLITVAQGLHWFDFESFFKLVQKYLKKGGVFAAWCYVGNRFESEKAQKVRDLFYDGKELTPFWSERRHFIENEYRTIPHVPYKENISFHTVWSYSKISLKNYIHYISTWSAVNAYIEKYGTEKGEKLLENYKNQMLQALELQNEDEEFNYNIPYHLLITCRPSRNH